MFAAGSFAETPKRKNMITPENGAMIAERLKDSNTGVMRRGHLARVLGLSLQDYRTVSKN